MKILGYTSSHGMDEMKKHTRQISFRAEADLSHKVEAAAAFEELSIGEMWPGVPLTAIKQPSKKAW